MSSHLFVCPGCDTTFTIRVISRSLAEGTCPYCGQRFQVSMEGAS